MDLRLLNLLNSSCHLLKLFGMLPNVAILDRLPVLVPVGLPKWLLVLALLHLFETDSPLLVRLSVLLFALGNPADIVILEQLQLVSDQLLVELVFFQVLIALSDFELVVKTVKFLLQGQDAVFVHCFALVKCVLVFAFDFDPLSNRADPLSVLCELLPKLVLASK